MAKFDALLASFLSVSDNRGNKTTKRTPDGAVTTKSAKLRWALFAALGVMLDRILRGQGRRRGP